MRTNNAPRPELDRFDLLTAGPPQNQLRVRLSDGKCPHAAPAGFCMAASQTAFGTRNANAYNLNDPAPEIEMTDVTTHRSLRVSTDGTAGPYIMVPVSQLDQVQQLLSRHGIHYWVDENAISLNGTPEIAIINLGRGAMAHAVQTVLDSVH